MSGNRSTYARAVAAFVFMSLGAVAPASAQDPAAADYKPITIYTRDAAARASGGAADQLVARAQTQGQVRVIVGLNTTMRMEHTLDASQLAAQRARLNSIQSGIATRVLGSPTAAGVVRFTFIPFMSMWVDAAQLRRLIGDAQVVSIQEDVPKPPLLAESNKVINADDIWAKGFNGTGQTIAILDTGVAKTHPMFAGGKVVSEACYSTTNGPSNFLSVCPGGVSGPGTGTGVNCHTSWTGCDHGTHVAGIAAGNSSTLDGVSRDSKIIAIQVFSRLTTTTPHSVRSFDTDQVLALQRVLALKDTYKIAAVNMSLGGGQFDTACDAQASGVATAITNLRNAGIATIIASGNDSFTGFISSPACISTAIAVGNTMKDDIVWRSSNHNALVKLMAPGRDIKSAIPGGTTAFKTGTSMAAPHVAGAFGMLRNVKPNATVNQILEALTCSGKIVDQRFVTGGNPIELSPQKPRIDLLGAYNHLRKPNNVVRAFEFTNANELKEWSQLRGKWVISSGLFRAPPPAGGGIAAHLANCNTKLTITSRLKRADPDTRTNWNTGLMFKVTTDFLNETVSGYWVAYNKCRTNATTGLCTGATADKPGQAVLWRATALNHQTGGAAGATQLCRKAIPITVGGFNTIKVVSNGSSHSFYLNSKLVCTITDATYASGGVTLDAFFPNPSGGHNAAWDSLSVQSIGANDARDEGDSVIRPASFAPTVTSGKDTIMSATP